MVEEVVHQGICKQSATDGMLGFQSMSAISGYLSSTQHEDKLTQKERLVGQSGLLVPAALSTTTRRI